MMMMATGLLMASSLLSLARADGYELEIVDSFQPTASNIIGYIAIGEEMHFELDLTIHAIPSTWASIFHCGSENFIRMPGIFLHPNSGTDGGSREGFYTCWSHDDDNDDCVQTDYLTVGQTYHLEIDITESLYTVTQDGVVQYSGEKADHTTYDSMVCYASDPWYGAADVTLSNIRVWAGAEQRFVAVNTKMTWSDANAYCASEYGTSLATISSDDEATALLDLITSDSAWIGLNDIDNEGTWVWASGYECEGDCADLDWWDGGEPNDFGSNGEDCAYRHDRTAWPYLNDVTCSDSHYFICDGYYPDNFARFVAVDTKMTWSDANDYCASEYGASLATITNDDEATALLDLITTESAWIGLNDIDNEGTWVWASGYECEGDCADLDWWDGGEPNDFGSNGEDCAERHDRTSWPYLNDVTCTDLHYFICDGNYADKSGGAHYVAQGRTSWSWGDVPDHYCQSDDDNQAAYPSNFGYDIGVGCCSEDGSNGYRPDCNAHPATYQEAVDLCNENGYRLCTVEESESGITEGTGCWYDAIYQWTSDSCKSTVSVNAAATVSSGEVIAEEANSAGNGSLDWMTTVIGAMIGVVAIGAVVVSLMMMTKKRKRAAEEEKTEMSNAVPQHVVPEMSISSVAVPATTSGATVEE